MDELLRERYELAKNRIHEIIEEKSVKEPFRGFFSTEASFLEKTITIMERTDLPDSMSEAEKENLELYEDILPENYPHSYGNPSFAAGIFGEHAEGLLFLYCEIRAAVVFAFEKKDWDMTVILELFLEVYSAFCSEEDPKPSGIRNILVSYVNDYCTEMVGSRIREAVDPAEDFAVRIVMDSDLSDLRYLYRYGEYISDNERRMAAFMNSLPEEEIEAMASTFTEGYRIGFENAKKPLYKKKTVNIRYHVGMERMIRSAIFQFQKMGLSPVIFRHAAHQVNRRNQFRNGYTGGTANPQYDYDHRQDSALFLDPEFVKKKLRAMQVSYEKYRTLAKEHGGPAVIETFGEKPFSPEAKKEAAALSDHQQKLQIEMDNEAAQIVNRYISGKERSFTIIAYPLPEIGENFEEIFREIVRINTLDYSTYQKIQQTIIRTLDSCEWVEIKGRNGNETDLLIHLHELSDPEKQTNFENCVADVNIPVGEVFTSPVLAGTGGVLHVQKVYLNGLLFKELKLVFDCGQVIDYTCSNFPVEEENRRYIEDNVLFHHNKLPMGEFAIGTNTTAYAASIKYKIADKLPILIAEKMGPHFAVGDTCYSWEEDNAVFNPDGREIIAKENEISALRKEDPGLAYYGCHTDITIPYDELGSIRVIHEDGEMTSIIEGGRFVLPGTEELNLPLIRLEEETQNSVDRERENE